MTEKQAFAYVDDERGFDALLQALSRSDRVGVDTESDSMHCYFEKVCLIQLSTPSGSFVLDPLALSERVPELGPLFADESILKIMHGADYDVVCLKRSFGIESRNIFDTMIAAQFLGVERFGLVNLVEDLFGVILEKKHTRTNWGRRPLTESELLYSYLDVKYLIELVESLEERLAEADLLEEVGLEFLRLEDREPASKEFDPDGYLRIRGSRELEPGELAILRELFLMRDRQARRQDRPPFKVLANDTLLRISRADIRGPRDLSRLRGVSSYVMRRYADGILGAVSRGRKQGQPPAARRRPPKSPRLSPRQQNQFERLKDWRRKAAQVRDVPTLVVLPNHAMQEVVRFAPGDLAALGALPSVGEKRALRHGEEILRILADGHPPRRRHG